jgi:hypothetical protein
LSSAGEGGSALFNTPKMDSIEAKRVPNAPNAAKMDRNGAQIYHKGPGTMSLSMGEGASVRYNEEVHLNLA